MTAEQDGRMSALGRLLDRLDARERKVRAQNARTNRELGLEGDDARFWRSEFERVQRENIRLRSDIRALLGKEGR